MDRLLSVLNDPDVIQERNQVIRQIMDKYVAKMPRFRVGKMNQAEFMIHVLTWAFNAGVRCALTLRRI